MKNYLISIIIASMAMGLCDIITPRHAGIEKCVKFVCGLIILSAIISPISNTISEIDDGLIDNLREQMDNFNKSESDYNDILKKYLADHSIADAKEHIKEILTKEFDIPNDECEINIYTDIINENISVSSIRILLCGASVFKNPYDIEEYVSSLYKTECQVLINTKRSSYE